MSTRKTLQELVHEVGLAREAFISTASGLSHSQASFKSSEEEWSVADNVEHMVWAEMGGINGIWKTAQAIKSNKPIWTGDAIHHGLPIEAIIEKTWRPKEQVPEIAKPRWGGPVEYWIHALRNCQGLLKELIKGLDGLDPEKIIYPHIISGPLNVIQRLEFLRFHLQRHQRQIENIKSHPAFPEK
jgi:hypothetical protein